MDGILINMYGRIEFCTRRGSNVVTVMTFMNVNVVGESIDGISMNTN
jgi:hypothetical protein